MATQLQDLQAKRAELQKTNPNATMLDAKSALSPSPIANAPVAWVAPAITPLPTETPTPTTSVHANWPSATEAQNQAIRQQNAQKVQAEIQAGTRPQVGQQATPTQVPEIVQQVETPAPTTPEVNSTNTPVTTPTKTETPKATGTYSTTTITPSTTTKTPVTPETPRDIAKNKKMTQYNGMTSSQFVDLLKQWQIPTEISSQLAQTNSQFQQAQAEVSAYQKSQARTNSYQSVYNWLTWQETPQRADPFTQISDKFMKLMWVDAWNTSYVEAFKQSLSQNDTVRWKTNELNAKQAELNTQIKARDDILKSYKQQYKDIPLSVVIAMASRDAQPINEQISTLQTERDAIKADLTYETELAKWEYDAQVKDMETKAGIRNSILSNLMSAEMGIATEQVRANIAEETVKRAMNDPAKAVPAMIEAYAKLWVPMQRSTQAMIQEAQNVIANGGNLADYLTELQGKIQSKSEYKRIQELQQWQLTDREKMNLWYAQDIAKLKLQNELWKSKKTPSWKQDINGNWYNENSDTPPNEQIGNWTVDIWEWTLLDVLGKNVWTYTWNRGYDLAWAKWDPLPAWWNWKVISTDTAWEQVWSIFKSGKWAKPYGNTVVMEDENGNQIRYSHLDSIWVNKDDILNFGSVVWTRGNTGHVLWANGETLTSEQLAQGRWAHVDIEIKDKTGRLLSNEEQKNYLAWIKKPEATQNLSIYKSYVEDWKVPSKDVLKWLKMTSEQFINNADAGYTQFLDKKAKELSDTYPTVDIAYTPTYAQNSAPQREKLNDSIAKISDIDDRISQLKKLFEKNWTEVWPTEAKKKMASLRQQIILKAKEVENLWVLNWPDLWILESLIPETTWIWSWISSFDTNTLTTLDSVQNNYRTDAKTKAINYGAKLIFADAVEKELANSF